MKVRLTPAAKNDVEAAYSWYRERGRLLARRFKAEVRTTADATQPSGSGALKSSGSSPNISTLFL